MTAVAGGQLLFNHQLDASRRWLLVAMLAAVLFYAFVLERGSASTWVGVGAVWGVLIWLRYPRLRWPLVIVILLLTVAGILLPAVYDFAGGEDEWAQTGGGRVVLIRRVLEVTMRNPVTGLGPAAYRPYANLRPLSYQHITWVDPNVSSHNNYVDLFAHTGVLGLGLFFWFVAEVIRLGLRLRTQLAVGFAAGYVNGMLAAGAGALVVMMLADWILPFVYNIGFSGFQASVLVWLFLGGLVAVEQLQDEKSKARG